MKTNTANRTSEGARYARPIANDRRSRAVHRITSRHRTVTFVQTRSVTCTHEPKILAAPRAKICEGCGSTYNLRLCADCGYVGCCESQKGHDRTHALETDHHVIKSLPLGEGSFTWCYAASVTSSPPACRSVARRSIHRLRGSRRSRGACSEHRRSARSRP